MFPVMQARTTSLTELFHQSSQLMHWAVLGSVLLTASHSLRASLRVWSAMSRIDEACVIMAVVCFGPWVSVGAGIGREEMKEVKSE